MPVKKPGFYAGFFMGRVMSEELWRLVGRHRCDSATRQASSHGESVHPRKSGRLFGRHRCDAATRQASAYRGTGTSEKARSAIRPPRVALAFDLLATSRGRVEVLRSGQPGMDAGLAAPGQGWPIAAGPRSRTGTRVCRALARHRTKGARALGYLGLFQVTRRKGETASGRYRSNGYVLSQQGQVGCLAVFAGKPAPTGKSRQYTKRVHSPG
ncbi:hypothetical protein BJ917_4421 [Pseudomonas sp. WPR_5_2]|nr:hypothetical protein BJ917_4421 [Pseudomonas sp. WPR_5_2]